MSERKWKVYNTRGNGLKLISPKVDFMKSLSFRFSFRSFDRHKFNVVINFRQQAFEIRRHFFNDEKEGYFKKTDRKGQVKNPISGL